MGRHLTIVAAAALAWLVVASTGPAQIAAPPNVSWIAYRNDTPVQVLVQASSGDRKAPPHRVNPREAAYDQVGQGPKTVTIAIYDTKGQLLCAEAVNFTGRDLFFSIQIDAPKGAKTIKVKLVPLADPRGLMPGGMLPGGGGGLPVIPGLGPVISPTGTPIIIPK
jgi:hypothetical protein